jgi:hypothetical protein
MKVIYDVTVQKTYSSKRYYCTFTTKDGAWNVPRLTLFKLFWLITKNRKHINSGGLITIGSGNI